MAGDPPVPQSVAPEWTPVVPRSAPAAPQLLGFAEPVTQVPPIEDFEAPAAEPAPEPTEPVALAPSETRPLPEPPPFPPELAGAGVGDFPPFAEPEPADPPFGEFEAAQPFEASSAPTERGGVEVSDQPPHDIEPEPLPEAPGRPPEPIKARVRDLPPVAASAAPAPSRPQNVVGRLGRRPPEAMPRADASSPLPAARRGAEPAPKLTTPAPAAERSTERGGRPSLPRNRRLHRRATMPAEIEIDGVPCTLIDVSIGGFAATGVPQLEPNALVPVVLRLTIDGIEVGTLLKARVIYVTQGRSSGRFVDLAPSQMAFLRYIVTWRGESVGAVGTTTLLDAISHSPERGFSPGAPPNIEAEAKSRWWAGLIGRKIHPPR